MQVPPESDTDLKVFGRLLRERRTGINWTLEDLAGAAFSNSERKGYVSEIERGRKNIGFDQVKSLCRALNISRLEIPASLRWFEPPREGHINISFPENVQLYSALDMLSEIHRSPVDYTSIDEDFLCAEITSGRFEFSSLEEALKAMGLIIVGPKKVRLVVEKENSSFVLKQSLEKQFGE